MPEISEADRPPAARRIIDALSQVVRYASPFKNEALALLKKYKPSAAMKAEEIARLTYQDAMEKADEAIASNEWDRGDRPAQGGHAQGGHRPRDRQGQHGPVQPGLLLLHEQAIL